MDDTSRASGQPVTVIARHFIVPGKEAEFERWVSGIREACSKYPGYLGHDLARAPSGHDSERASIFRFDTLENLHRWYYSEERQGWLERAVSFSSQPAEILHYQSLEFLFPSDDSPRGPARYKMALLTLAALLPLVHFLPPLFSRFVPWPALVIEIVATALIVALMTYVVMPLVTRLFSRWLWPRSSRRHEPPQRDDAGGQASPS